jgi:hypothetical protein
MSPKKRALIAIPAGLLLSVFLFILSYATHSALLAWPQVIGFFSTMALRGVHSATKIDFAIIGIPANAVIYASLIFALSSLGPRRKNPK